MSPAGTPGDGTGVRVGVDIGGTKILAGVVGSEGRVVDSEGRETPHRTAPADVVEGLIADAVAALQHRHAVEAVGIAAAGFVDAAGSRVMFAPHLSWRDEPLRDRLGARLGLPVTVANDANAALWAEHVHGRARGARDVVMVTLGTGIGGALMIDGRLHVGRNGMAGEFGHIRVVPDGRPCECGHTGCWEQYCSGKALARFAADAGSPLSGPALTEAAERRDPVARGAYLEVGRWLGTGLADLVAGFDPELVLVGGGVSAAGELLLEPARRALHEALVGSGHRSEPELSVATLGPYAGLVGAAELTRL
ncbi:glucokinase [Marmoricola endophyticus]|uniref:Glucokinase n=1 Tax=Marmoricola endophyticus TaxID=2040280 RepID=A0A917EYR2_9ACTN|nr:ROK family protein [Marmoricola endophyticus]GGF31588.1 glucokinase [Marmoricola endophyticus]